MRGTMSNFVKIGKTFAAISRFYCFQVGGRCHLGFSKIKFLNGWYAWETKSEYTCLILLRLANSLLRYGDFSIIQDGGRPPCWILKSTIFKVQYSPEYPWAWLRQIRSKSVKLLRRHGDLTLFQTGGRRQVGFRKIQILNGSYVRETKFTSLC